MTTPKRTVFSFARMMVLAQRRHEARIAAQVSAPEPVQRAEAARRTLQKMNGTKRLVVFMYAT
jgi:hypothetical protein